MLVVLSDLPLLMMSKRGRVIVERDLYFVYLYFVFGHLLIFSMVDMYFCCGHKFLYIFVLCFYLVYKNVLSFMT